MSFTRRRLPHQYPEGKWLFVTWHLHGSLPHTLYPPPDKLSGGKAFGWMDRYLDSARQGPMYLRQPRIAQIVLASLRRGIELGHYRLHAYVLMANHVHVLLLPRIPPARLAILHDRGEIGVGETLHHRSIVDSVFDARVLAAGPHVGGHATVITEVEGAAYRTGEHRFSLDDRDPLGRGFLLR
jgi:hypothetical protein